MRLALFLTLLLTACGLDDVQRRNVFESCVGERIGMEEDWVAQVAEVEANWIEAGLLGGRTKADYRAWVQQVFAEQAGAGDPVGAVEAGCAGDVNCGALTTPRAFVAVPHCYRQMRRDGWIKPSDSTWHRQSARWARVLATARFREADLLATLQSLPPNQFQQPRFRGVYVLWVLRVEERTAGSGPTKSGDGIR